VSGLPRALLQRLRRLPRLARLVGAVVAVGVGCGGCGRESSNAPSAVAMASDGAVRTPLVRSPDAAARAPDVEDLWVRAKEGEPDDLARLANREGASGLVEEGSRDPVKKKAAIAALAYADGLSGLPWLAEAADAEDEATARAAVESIVAMAARTRRAVDPEDGAELRTGCDRLLSIAKNPSKKRPVRVGAVRALRMWTDRGCAKTADLPTDVDTH
jgi:hypothetical protein